MNGDLLFLDMHKKIIRLASLLMILAIILGAFGAHFLKAKISETSLSAYQTGVLYHIVHALALLVLGISQLEPSKQFKRSIFFIVLGIIFFSGSLYLLSLKDIIGNSTFFNVIGPITPIGGISFIIGWVFLFLSSNKE